jgi:hypothetical protein
LPGWHSPLESQHPVGQLVALQCECSQDPSVHDACVPLHVTQTLPKLPQSEVESPLWQMSCWSQQPLGHVSKEHVAPWHCPPTHASPDGHDAHAFPPEPQSFNVIPVWQAPVASQQPVGHVVALHEELLHIPALQLSPDGHAVHAAPPLPHAPRVVPDSQKPSASQQPIGQLEALHVVPMHAPPVQESPGGHGRHALPPTPHADVLVPDSQIPRLSQQPFGQLVALQVVPWHDPALQESPEGHTAQALPPLPHAVVLVPDSQAPAASQHPVGHVITLHGLGWHAPPVQTSAEGQAVHASPPRPHAPVLVPDSQKPKASQQPVGHVVGSQTTPLHTPAEQESPGGQGKHAWPPVPHADVLLPFSQRPKPSQQPDGQVAALHVVPWHEPIVHVSPVGHATHVLPPLPHEVVLPPDSQIAPLQHPVGQVAALHGIGWQLPPLHVSSGGHTVHALPPRPHAPVTEPDSQKPSASQHPVGQVVASHPAPLQAPPAQESAGGQGRHALPPVPHAETLSPGSHFPELSQQPVGQVEALHVAPKHAPSLQESPGGQASQAPPPLPHDVVLRPDSQTPAPSQHPAGQVVALHGGGSQVWKLGLQTRPLPVQS